MNILTDKDIQLLYKHGYLSLFNNQIKCSSQEINTILEGLKVKELKESRIIKITQLYE